MCSADLLVKLCWNLPCLDFTGGSGGEVGGSTGGTGAGAFGGGDWDGGVFTGGGGA